MKAERKLPQPASEQGAVIVIFALLLTVLLTFAALAVDIGGAYNQRRQTQSAVDVATLAAAQELDPNFDSNCALGTAVQTCVQTNIVNYVNQALRTAYTTSTFDTCGGYTPPTTVGSITGINWQRIPSTANGCIAIESGGLMLWARTPPAASYQTAFARVIGVDSVPVGAFAVTGLRPQGIGGVLPFGVQSTASGLACLKTASGNNATNCVGQTSGNFGYLQFAQYGNAQLGTPFQTQCSTSGKSGARWPTNTAAGVDHPLSIYDPANPVDRLEGASGCTVLKPDETTTETGTDNTPLDAGLVTGTAGPLCNTCIDDKFGTARLTRVGNLSTDYYTRTVAINDGGMVNVNDTGLWEFIPAVPNDDTPVSCARTLMLGKAALGVDPATSELFVDEALATCFSDYNLGLKDSGPPVKHCANGANSPCTGQLFNTVTTSTNTTKNPQLLDIQLNPRFGYVPILDGSSGLVHFLGFRAVYIDQLAFSQGNSSVVWSPDYLIDKSPAVTGNPVRAVGAWIFNPTMLSPCSGDLTKCVGTDPNQFTTKPIVQLLR